MQSSRLLGLLTLLLLAAAAVLWFALDRSAPAPATDEARAVGAAGEAGEADAARAPDTADASDRAGAGAGEAVSRVEAASAPDAEPEAAWTGQVVDDRDRPVAGATVGCVPWFDLLAMDEFDPDQFDPFETDPASAMARITMPPADAVAATTDAEGRFRVAAPAAERRLALRIAARGHRLLEQPVARPSAGEVDVGVLRLTRGAVIAGRVVDHAGRGIANARVLRVPGGVPTELIGQFDFDVPDEGAFPGRGADRVVTDADGRFELAHAAPGEFSLRTRHEAHPSAQLGGLEVAAGGVLRDLLLTLEPGASIRGRVTGIPDGAPALRVLVMQRREAAAGTAGASMGWLADFGGEMLSEFPGFGERNAEVGADGSFEVRGLRVGVTYRIWATNVGRGVLGTAAPCTQRLEVTTPIDGLELRYEPGVSVTFRVVDEAGGAPIERLWVQHVLKGGGGMEELMAQAMGRRARAGTYDDGRVTIAGLRPKEGQTLTLSIEALGHRAHERSGIVLPRSGELDLGLVRLAPAPVLRLEVAARNGGAPIGDATVRVRPADGETRRRGPFAVAVEGMRGRGADTGRTDEHGRCVVNAPVDGSFVVVVRHPKYAEHESTPLRLGSAGLDHRVELARGGCVEVTVVDAAGAAVSKQRVERRGPDGDRGSETTNQDGVATFDRLPPGEHGFRVGGTARGAEVFEIAIEAAGAEQREETGWQVVDVADEAVVELRLERPATATLRGVVRENGVPLGGARLAFLQGDEAGELDDLAGMVAEFGGPSGRTARSGDDGRYELRDLPEGTHRVRVTARSRAMPTVTTVALAAGDNVIDIDLDVAIVRGVVRGADGQPLEGASVRIAPVRTGEAQDAMAAVGEIMPGGLEGLTGGGRSVKTDAAGRFELRGVRTGVPLQVTASAKRYAAAQSEPFELAPGAARDGIDLQLLRAGRVEVTMTTKAAFAVATARRLGPGGEVDDGARPILQMLRNGKGVLDGLTEGRWRIAVQSPSGDGPAPQDVDVVAGQTVPVSF